MNLGRIENVDISNRYFKTKIISDSSHLFKFPTLNFNFALVWNTAASNPGWSDPNTSWGGIETNVCSADRSYELIRLKWFSTGMDAEQVFHKLQDGYRMERAKYATNLADEVMRMCWHSDPIQRPSFDQLDEMLGSQLETSLRRQYIDLNDPYVQSNVDRTEDYLSMMADIGYANVTGRPPSLQLNNYVNIPSAAETHINKSVYHSTDVNSCYNNLFRVTLFLCSVISFFKCSYLREDYLMMFPRIDLPSPSSETSDYLSMCSPKSPLSPVSPSISTPQFVAESGYSSVKSSKVNEKDAVDTVEMCPILNNGVRAFSNPQYQDHSTLKLFDSNHPPKNTSKKIQNVFRFWSLIYLWVVYYYLLKVSVWIISLIVLLLWMISMRIKSFSSPCLCSNRMKALTVIKLTELTSIKTSRKSPKKGEEIIF